MLKLYGKIQYTRYKRFGYLVLPTWQISCIRNQVDKFEVTCLGMSQSFVTKVVTAHLE